MNARRRVASRRSFPDNLYCKPDGYFWYRNPETGKTKGLGRDRADAFRQARLANAALASKESTSLADWVMGKDGKTIAEWAAEYQQLYIETRNAEANTIASLKAQVRAILAADFAHKLLQDVTTKDVAAFVDEAAVSRGARMAGTIRSCLNDMFREAEVKGLISSGANPVTVTRKPKAEVQRDRLSLEQFLAIRDHASGWMANAMDLALLSGQRREDLSEAKFADIRDGYWYIIQGKTGSKLRIPLTLRLAAVNMTLGDVVKQCRDNVLSPYLIHHVKKNTFNDPGMQVWKDTISKGFAKARVKAGIEWQEGREPPTFHEIRSLAERLYEKEYGRSFAQKLLGHKSERMTAAYADVRGSEWMDVAVSV